MLQSRAKESSEFSYAVRGAGFREYDAETTCFVGLWAGEGEHGVDEEVAGHLLEEIGHVVVEC